MPAEDISICLEDLGFNVINVRLMMATQTARIRQTHVEPLPLFLVTLTRNIKSQEIFKLNSLNHVIIKVDLYRVQIGYDCQNFGHVWANCKHPLDICVAVVATCKANTESTPSCCICTLVEGETM
jgi:hypothetical protein